MSHDHAHGSLRLRAGSPEVARGLAIAVLVVLVATVGGLVALRPRGRAPKAPGVTPGTTFPNGSVMEVDPVNCPKQYGDQVDCSTARVRVTSGSTTGDIALLPVTAGIPGSVVLHPGDQIRMAYFAKGTPGYRYTFDDFQRRSPMIWLAVVFVLVLVLLSRLQGLRALVGMGVSLLVVIGFLLPALLRGGPPLPLAVVTALVVAFAALYLAHGIHVGTHVAFLGSALALLATTGLGAAFVAACHFTGYADDTVATLVVAAGKLDVRGLILAGLVVGALGVLDDITVTQVSAVAELQRADPALSAYDLYRSGLRIGRDHVASTVNTLVLAYAGASLPLLMLFAQGGRSIGGVLTTETVAVEVVRAIVGSIGLVAAVPITTGLAAWVVHRPAGSTEPEPEDDEERDPWLDDGADFWDRR